MLYFLAAGVLALAVSVETYFQNWRWPWMALLAVGGATILSVVLMVLAALPAPGYALDAATGVPTAAILPPELRLLTPFMNVTGAFALILGALFSAYVFMPKRRLLRTRSIRASPVTSSSSTSSSRRSPSPSTSWRRFPAPSGHS